jgi:hypothetical protein
MDEWMTQIESIVASDVNCQARWVEPNEQENLKKKALEHFCKIFQ